MDQFLDRAVMATASRVRIVHGHGMGMLQEGSWELLAQASARGAFYQAPQQEGGAGATIVELQGIVLFQERTNREDLNPGPVLESD